MKTRFGTNSMASLDIGASAHLIKDSYLQRSDNGWTAQDGVVSCAPGRELLYSGYGAISCLSAGRMDGTDSLAWMDGDDVYINGGKIGEINAGTEMVAKDFDDKFFFLGSDDGKNFVYDGDVLRQHGPWQMNDWRRFSQDTYVNEDSDQASISGITNADPLVITTATSNTVSAGESFYVDGIVGMEELNGRVLVAQAATATTITVDEDASGYGAWSSGGVVTTFGCGLSGTYKYYIVPTVKFSDNSVLEGKPRGLRFGVASETFEESDSWEPTSLALSPTDEVQIKFRFTPDYDISGTINSDYFIGVRLYRTKADGVDIYLEEEWWSDGTGISESGGEYNVYTKLGGTGNYRSVANDLDLGSVYLADFNAHGTPHPASLMALVGQRLFMNDTDNPERMYFTGLDGIDYAGDLSYLVFPDVITGIGSVGAVGVVFSTDRMWRVSMLGGLPDVDEIESSVGTSWGNAMATTDAGLMFLREDGMWVTSGHEPPVRFSRRGIESVTSPRYVAKTGELICCGGSDQGWTVRRRDDGLRWHGLKIPGIIVDASNGKFYAADDHSIYEMFSGDGMPCVVQTKDWTDYSERQVTRVLIDFEGDDIPQVFANGNREGDYEGHPDEGHDREGERRLLWFSIPRWLGHVFSVQVHMAGDARLYGVWLEAE